jgi:hypothetical protein
MAHDFVVIMKLSKIEEYLRTTQVVHFFHSCHQSSLKKCLYPNGKTSMVCCHISVFRVFASHTQASLIVRDFAHRSKSKRNGYSFLKYVVKYCCSFCSLTNFMICAMVKNITCCDRARHSVRGDRLRCDRSKLVISDLFD